MSYKIGLLSTRSILFPSMGFDIAEGLQSGLKNMQAEDFEIKSSSIGVGGDYKSIANQCEQMLLEGADIIVAYLNPKAIKNLQPYLEAANKILLVLDPGYNYYDIAPYKNIFYISLQGTLCCRLTGEMAVKKGSGEIAYATSFYDAGYNSSYAFYRGYSQAGGTVIQNHVTKLSRAEFTLQPVAESIANKQGAAVIGSFCGDMMEDFCKYIQKNDLFDNQLIFAAPFAAEEQWLKKIPYSGKDIYSCVSWASTIDNEENATFKKALAANNKNANVFSLLGWEAATIIASARTHADTKSAIASLEGFSYKSPRGEVKIGKESHATEAPVYTGSIVKSEDGNSAFQLEESITDLDEHRDKIKADAIELNGAGNYWFNAYACLES